MPGGASGGGLPLPPLDRTTPGREGDGAIVVDTTNRLVRAFPDSRYLPQALISAAHHQMLGGRTDLAQRTLLHVVASYPESPAAAQAKQMLAGLTRQVDFRGSIASVGLAGGAELKTTVMPFILRGVSLLGINSSATPRAERLEVWQRIATDLTPRHLDRMVTRVIPFAELPSAFQAHLDGKVTGRTVVKIS